MRLWNEQDRGKKRLTKAALTALMQLDSTIGAELKDAHKGKHPPAAQMLAWCVAKYAGLPLPVDPDA